MRKKLVHDSRDISDKHSIIRQYNYALTRYFSAQDYLDILEAHLIDQTHLIEKRQHPDHTEVFELNYVKELRVCIKITQEGVNRLHKELLHYDKLREIWWDTIGQEVPLNIYRFHFT